MTRLPLDFTTLPVMVTSAFGWSWLGCFSEAAGVWGEAGGDCCELGMSLLGAGVAGWGGGWCLGGRGGRCGFCRCRGVKQGPGREGLRIKGGDQFFICF